PLRISDFQRETKYPNQNKGIASGGHSRRAPAVKALRPAFRAPSSCRRMSDVWCRRQVRKAGAAFPWRSLPRQIERESAVAPLPPAERERSSVLLDLASFLREAFLEHGRFEQQRAQPRVRFRRALRCGF